MAFTQACYSLKQIKVRRIAIARLRDIDRGTYREIVNSEGNWNFNILFSSGGWLGLPVKPDASYSLSSDDTNHGTRYTHNCRGVLQPNTTASMHTMVSYKEEDVLVKITDDQGLDHLMGTLEQPCQLRFVKDLGPNSGISFDIACAGRHPLYGFAPVVNV